MSADQLKVVRTAADESEFRYNDPDRLTPEQIAIDHERDRLTRERWDNHMQRLGRKETLMHVLGDVIEEWHLSPDETKARLQRIFGEP